MILVQYVDSAAVSIFVVIMVELRNTVQIQCCLRHFPGYSSFFASFGECCIKIETSRGERYVETIASLDQWSMTIENH